MNQALFGKAILIDNKPVLFNEDILAKKIEIIFGGKYLTGEQL